MSQLATRNDLLNRKALERVAIARPRERALIAAREVTEARATYWDLVGEFVTRAQELGIQPRICESPKYSAFPQRVDWVEGYPLTSGAVVSVPPLQYCISERRRVLSPQGQVRQIDELSLFVVVTEYEVGLGIGPLEHQTATGGSWPRLYRLDKTNEGLTALKRELEASLLSLMD